MSVALTEATARIPAQAQPRRRALASYLTMPVLLFAVLLGLYLAVRSRPLDSIEQRLLAPNVLSQATIRHLELSFVSTVLVLLIAIPMGILLTRPFAARATRPAIGVFNIGQAIPSIGLVVL